MPYFLIKNLTSCFLILAYLLFSISCSNIETSSSGNLTSQDLYQQAINEANIKNYLKANELFDLIQRDFPYSSWATKSKLMSAWVYYENNKYDAAISIAERFIQNHPQNELVSYAYYLIAMSYYERIIDVERDARMTFKAKEAFEKLILLFPNSDYARDSKLKIELARSNIAGKQMAIGRFYQKQKQYAAAIKRFKTVIKEYETTDQTPEALLRLSECYLAVGAKDEAERTASVLLYNFPSSIWISKMPIFLKRNTKEKPLAIKENKFFSSIKSIF